MAYYKRNLPHYQPEGYAFFITFRLHGTLPAEVINRLKAFKEKSLKLIAEINNKPAKAEEYSELKSEYFKLYDDYLDKALSGFAWLKVREIAEIVKASIHFRDGKEYSLIAYTIMPNHIHMVFIPIVRRDFSHASVSNTSDVNINPQAPVERFAESLKPPNKRNGISLYLVTKILQDLKKYTARECNKLLKRTWIILAARKL